jgi:hypothetical protein
MNGIKTIYKGIEYKSRLEADIAEAIDKTGHSYQYEPKSFLLPNGIHYMPDFYIPALKLWVEARGYETEKGDMQIQAFADMITSGEFKDKPDYMVVTYQSAMFAEDEDRYGYAVTDECSLVLCRDCKKFYFMGDGSYQCRYCGAWDGNSHIAEIYSFKNSKELKGLL